MSVLSAEPVLFVTAALTFSSFFPVLQSSLEVWQFLGEIYLNVLNPSLHDGPPFFFH